MRQRNDMQSEALEGRSLKLQVRTSSLDLELLFN